MQLGSVYTGLDKYIVMDLIDLLFGAAIVYSAFKFGESWAYLKISLRLKSIQNLSDDEEPRIGKLLVERINDQYYAYVDGTFVGQGTNLNDAYEILQNIIVREPGRFSSIKIQVIE